ncbi:MAG: hypothetical protein LBU18_07670 [Treponema sp.]|jgi:hypothetical protein|nr:hypothetical protein [Treponema sp.]
MMMEKKKLLIAGAVSVLLALALAGCPAEADVGSTYKEGGNDPGIVGKWYGSQTAADAGTKDELFCEFTFDGRVLEMKGHEGSSVTYTASDGKLTLSAIWMNEVFGYSIIEKKTETKLTLTDEDGKEEVLYKLSI